MFNNSVKFVYIHVIQVMKGNKRSKKAEALDVNLILTESWGWTLDPREAAFQMHSFRDTKPKPWIPPNAKNILECLLNSLDQNKSTWT